MIKVVCFDFGGVYRKVQRGEHSWRDIWKNKQREIGKKIPYKLYAHLQRRLDSGEISLKDFHLTLFRKIRKKYTEEELIIYSKPKLQQDILDSKIRKIVSKLRKKRYLVPLISNTIKEKLWIHRKKGDYKIFSHEFISCELGLSKDDTSIYRFACKKLRITPKESVMVDDNPDFLRPARKIGMKTILFKNSRQLEKELEKIGVL